MQPFDQPKQLSLLSAQWLRPHVDDLPGFARSYVQVKLAGDVGPERAMRLQR